MNCTGFLYMFGGIVRLIKFDSRQGGDSLREESKLEVNDNWQGSAVKSAFTSEKAMTW